MLSWSRRRKRALESLIRHTTAFGEATPDTSRIWMGTFGKSPGILDGKSKNKTSQEPQPVPLSRVGLWRACTFLSTLTDGVPKVPKRDSEDFCHFWHLVTLGF